MTESCVQVENLQFVDPDKNAGVTATFDIVEQGRHTIRRCSLRFDERADRYVVLGPFPGTKSSKSVVTFAHEYAEYLIPLVLQAAEAEASRIEMLFGGVQ